MTEVVIRPDKDAYVHQSNADTRYGDTDSLVLKTGASGALGSTEYETFLHFDLSVLKEGIVIDSAILRLYVESGVSASSGIEVDRITEDWQENSVTWNNKPVFVDTITVAGALSAFEFKDITITSFVERWIDNSYENKGLRVQSLALATQTLVITSSDSNTFSQRPQLVINFHDGPTKEAQKVTKLTEYLPNFWWDSKVLESINKAIAPELTLLDMFLTTQSSQTEDELTDYLNNVMGWGYERLINQQFISTTNHFLDKFRSIFEVQTDFPVYADLRNRLLLYSRAGDTNAPQDMEDEIDIVGEITGFIENYALYTITLSIRVDKIKFQEVVLERINKTRPAHIGGTILFYVCALDDSPPCELGDADAILMGSPSLT